MEPPMKRSAQESFVIGMLALPVTAVILCATFSLVLLDAWVACAVWQWHIMPAFPQLPALGWKFFFAVHALWIVSPWRRASTAENDVFWLRVLGSALGALLVLVFAWWLR